MDVDVYAFMGLAVPIALTVYVIKAKIKPIDWCIAAPLLFISFIGSVSNAGFAALQHRSISDRYLMGLIIMTLAIIGIILLVNKNSKE